MISGARAQLVGDNKLLTSLRAQRKILLDQVKTLDQNVSYWDRCSSNEGREVVDKAGKEAGDGAGQELPGEQGPCRA